MDVVSAVASLVNLIQGAAILVTVSRDMCNGIINAPKELHDVTEELIAIHAELEYIRRISCETENEPLSLDIRQDIENGLRQAREALKSMKMICGSMSGNTRISSRLRWVYKDRKAADQALTRLRASQDRLRFLANLLSMQAQKLLSSKMSEMTDAMSKWMQLNCTPEVVKNHEPHSPCMTSDQSRQRLASVKPWSLGSRWAFLGVRGSFIPTIETDESKRSAASNQEDCVDYSVALQISLPLARIVGSFALLLTASVRTFPLTPGVFDLLKGNLVLARLVKEDDPFIVACWKGDLIAVRTMLQSGEGRTTDITAANWSPLAYAIWGGNVDVVKVLLRHGANKNGSFGQRQTTPLQWAVWQQELDITRLLLREGASQEHLTKIGWNVTFFCWPVLEAVEREMTDFLNLLNEHEVQDLDIADDEGWTVLHRVAAYGKPTELERLIQLGADPEKVALPLQWNAIHHAVFYGNYPTFEVLLKLSKLEHSEIDIRTLVDERGWTLLHIAASAGHDDIVRRLLQLELNPLALTKPFRSHMPEVLFDQKCTPQQVAAAQGPAREKRYLDVLGETYLPAGSTKEEKTNDVEDEDLEFWEAVESFE